ncbi:response regulator receiver protein [Natrinema saccharevitans]|uniref:Response regulator receiver protein n=1 Tax=Natrinema saccharevitans TaxID=301967 RepID=A0A1S8ARG2_9EURY|nr:helix-turn-helix domain-containing protein [Natrinema saccharevitans]OLZ39398.1 response regulator receiver protein [Natrinema saccharevitans]
MTVNSTDGPVAGSDERSIAVVLIDDDETWVRTQRRLLERAHDRLQVSTATSFEEAQTTLDEQEPDCIVCDYQLGDGTGLDLLTAIRADEPEIPFLLVTGEGNEAVASDAIGEQVTDYIRKRDLSAQPTRLARRIESAVTAARTRRALTRERKTKETLLELVTASTTREELGRNVCEHLVDTGYACAWIGILDDDRQLVPLSAAGDRAYLEAALTPDTRPTNRSEPAFLALDRTEPVVRSLEHTVGTTESVAEGAKWEQLATDHDFRSVAALPISHDELCFGVLTVYSQSPRIDSSEQTLLSEYTETVGYAFQTTAWKRTLLSSATATVTFSLNSRDHPLATLAAALPETVTLQTSSVIPRNDDNVLYVTTLRGTTKADLTTRAASSDTISSIEFYRTDAENRVQCGLIVASPTPETLLVDAGVSLSHTVIEDETAKVTAVVGPETTVQECVGILSEAYGESNVMTVWTASERPAKEDTASEELTDRQRQVLELAIEAGYFERPRHNNTSELADALGISRATFTQHLRAAQRKLFTSGVHKQ